MESKTDLLVNAELRTFAEATRGAILTDYDHMLSYLNRLAAFSSVMTVEEIGKSGEERAIPTVILGTGVRPIVCAFAQQHGDEPAGCEALLRLARLFAMGPLVPMLNRMTLVLVPQLNPDGATAEKRQNAAGLDLNRDHLHLQSPELNAFYQRVINRWNPEVTLDLHEYRIEREDWVQRGYLLDEDIMLDAGTNLNIAPELRQIGTQEMLPRAISFAQQRGFNARRYFLGHTQGVVRYSNLHANDGRNVPGLYQSISFILESGRVLNTLARLTRRVGAHVAVITALLQYVAQEAEAIVEQVNQARLTATTAEGDKLHLQARYEPEEQTEPFAIRTLALPDGQPTTLTLDRAHTRAVSILSTTRPRAYAVLRTAPDLTEILKTHNIRFEKLEAPRSFDLATFYVESVYPVAQEGQPTYKAARVTTRTTNLELPEGSVIIPMQQVRASLVALLLEPESMDSLINSGMIDVVPGGRYPIARVV